MAENNSSAPLKTAEGAAHCLPALTTNDELPEAVIDAVAAALGDTYDCLRVWSAWSYGTMGPDDFRLVAEDGERTAEIARAAIEAYVAATQAVAAQAPAAVVFAEARECSHCNHVGINDSADGVAACISCEWHGDSPKDDKCPECEAEGTMTASCPKCHHEYRLLADASIAAPALPATEDSSEVDQAEVAQYCSTGKIHRYMLDCSIDGVNQFREFVLASDHDSLVHDVLANADPAGMVQENGLMRDQVRQLDAMVGRLKKELSEAEVQAEPVANCYSGDDGDTWRD